MSGLLAWLDEDKAHERAMGHPWTPLPIRHVGGYIYVTLCEMCDGYREDHEPQETEP